MTSHEYSALSRDRRRRPRAIVGLVLGLIVTLPSCRDAAPVREEVVGGPAAAGPIAIEWTDADLEKNASRVGYGSKPDGILARGNDGALVFTPQTPEDHIATQFTRLQNYDGNRSLELVLDVQAPGGEACVANLQDQAYNVLTMAPCRTAGEQRAMAKVPGGVTSVRVYFLSANREPLRLPARMRLTEQR